MSGGVAGSDAGIVEYMEDTRRFLKLAGVESARCYEAVSQWRAESLPAEFRPLGRFDFKTKARILADEAIRYCGKPGPWRRA